MKHLPVLLTEPAITDINGISDYIEEATGSTRVALRYVERINERCRSIGNAPRGGRLRDDLMPGLRSVPFERTAIICYMIEEHCVLITNVFHGGRDFEAVLRSPSEKN